MTSRDAILTAVRAARPPLVALPAVRMGTTKANDLATEFVAAAEASGATVKHATRDEVDALIGSLYGAGRTVSAIRDASTGVASTSPLSFADSHLFVCEGVLGVAENGAVWLPLSRLHHRSAIFLSTNVIILLSRSHIVRDLHDAYNSIDVTEEGFGVFIAGPSKTADIEQALVIGAHGAMSLTIILTD